MNDEIRLFPVCVSHELKDLSHTPHRNIGGTDLAIVAGYRGKMVSSIMVNGVAVPEEEILAAAESGKPDFQFDSMESLLGLGEDAADTGQYVLTTEGAFFGAAALGYPEELEKAAKFFGEGFYILPSSVHEVILLPDSRTDGIKPDELQQIVAEINSTQVRENERLSNSVYHFDGESIIPVAGPAAEDDFSEEAADDGE